LANTGTVKILNLRNGYYGSYPLGQDQLFLYDEATGLSLTTPEPTSLAIWAIAGGLGAAGLRFKRRRQGRWSDENRQAIMDIVQGRPQG
jgi:hypothetical protein